MSVSLKQLYKHINNVASEIQQIYQKVNDKLLELDKCNDVIILKDNENLDDYRLKRILTLYYVERYLFLVQLFQYQRLQTNY